MTFPLSLLEGIGCYCLQNLLRTKKNLRIVRSLIERNVVSSQFFYNHPSHLLISSLSPYINKIEFALLLPGTTEAGVRVGMFHRC